MKNSHYRLLFLSTLILIYQAQVAVTAEPQWLGPVTLTNSERFMLDAENINQTFQIDISLPSGYQSSDQDYPVAYLIDSNLMFPAVDFNARGLQLGLEVPGFILVGIGYKVDNDLQALALRNRDLLPSYDAEWVEESRQAPPPLTLPENINPGGAEKFLKFINEELKAVINSHYRVNTENQTLVGYSFGGLFSLFTLFKHTDSFDRYVIGSPSVWWHDQLSLDFEEQYAENNEDLAKAVFISSGGLEEEPGSEDFRMISNAREVWQRLVARNYPNLKIAYTIFDGETHLSRTGVAINRGLKFVLNQD